MSRTVKKRTKIGEVYMTLDHETRTVLFEKLKLTKEDIDNYEKGTLSLSGYNEYKLRSGKLSRKISR